MLVNDDDSVSTSLLAKLQFQDVTLQAAACITDMQKFKKKTLKNRWIEKIFYEKTAPISFVKKNGITGNF